MKTYYHYADFLPLEVQAMDPPKEEMYAFKPNGLWVTDDSEDSWLAYCKRNPDYFDINVKRMIVEIHDDANLLWLQGEEEICRFSNEYLIDRYRIDWKRLHTQYDGIMIFPFVWSLRFDLVWYWSWDCASGCIWQPRAIKRIQHE